MEAKPRDEYIARPFYVVELIESFLGAIVLRYD
jgi:hypothetical protein